MYFSEHLYKGKAKLMIDEVFEWPNIVALMQ